jgi:hypothetical protein
MRINRSAERYFGNGNLLEARGGSQWIFGFTRRREGLDPAQNDWGVACAADVQTPVIGVTA